jgi:hypothetical protein
MITIGLPNYASNIAWLAMESLCEQITPYKWELIVYEDSDRPLEKEYFTKYQPRLKEAGCVRVVYLYSEERVPLNQKWLKMAELSDPNSLGLVLQATDCYSEPLRLATAEIAFSKGADWIQSPRGYFFNILTRQFMLFEQRVLNDATGLNMAVSMSAIKQMPKDEDKWQSVDSWLFANLPKGYEVFNDTSSNWLNGLDTDGFNRISLSRRTMYSRPKPPFGRCKTTLSQILPIAICERLLCFKG